MASSFSFPAHSPLLFSSVCLLSSALVGSLLLLLPCAVYSTGSSYFPAAAADPPLPRREPPDSQVTSAEDAPFRQAQLQRQRQRHPNSLAKSERSTELFVYHEYTGTSNQSREPKKGSIFLGLEYLFTLRTPLAFNAPGPEHCRCQLARYISHPVRSPSFRQRNILHHLAIPFHLLSILFFTSFCISKLRKVENSGNQINCNQRCLI